MPALPQPVDPNAEPVPSPTPVDVSASTSPMAGQLTARALLSGLVIGALLAAGNVYTALKSSFIDGGALSAALLSFTFFATFRRGARRPFSQLENNVAQTAASSAAFMAFVHGLMGPMPALMLMGRQYPAWALWLWGITLAAIGLAIGILLRRRLVVDDKLPFPSGTATAELIKAIHSDQGSARHRTRLLVGAALLAAAITWFRDGKPSVIPQGFYLPITVAGLGGAALTLGTATSPLMAATGVLIGTRAALSLVIGSVIGWGILVPRAAGWGWTKDSSYQNLVGWLVWPALGVLLSNSIVPGLLAWRKLVGALRRTFRDARRTGHGAAASAPQSELANQTNRRLYIGIVVVASGLLLWTGWKAFGFSPIVGALALAVSVVLAAISSRAAGETDIAPVGPLGSLAQVLFAGGGSTSSILSGAIVAGNASEAAASLWAFKAGRDLRASMRAQVVAQFLGALVGSLVVVPVYLLVIRAYPLGSERMPAVVALSWKATAEALTGSLHGAPPHAGHAFAVTFAAGTILVLLGRTRLSRHLPSVIALGIGFITPLSLASIALIGALLALLIRRRWSSIGEGETNAAAAGLLAGESIIGVLIAALASAGLL